MRKWIMLSILCLSGCNMRVKSDQQSCLDKIKESYCKPTAMRDEFNDVIYDCTGINNPAYDAAIKACLEKK